MIQPHRLFLFALLFTFGVPHVAAQEAQRVPRPNFVWIIADGEELYDHESDPNEWTNLASDPQYVSVKKELADELPKSNAKALKRTRVSR